MLMDAGANFDATDPIGRISEHSAQSDSPHSTHEQAVKLSNELDNMQIEGKNPKFDMKSNLPKIEEVLTATPTTAPATTTKAKATEPNPIDEVKGNATPRKRMILTPSAKKTQNFNPSIKSIRSQIHVTKWIASR